MEKITNHNIRKIFALYIVFWLLKNISVYGQFPDSVKTGHLLDAAEEYWPAARDSITHTSFFDRIKHMPINDNKGFNSVVLNVRESYEIFRNYLWGIGTQDKGGYFLHRVLLHNDFRWNQHLRIFAEAQSSTISGRNGGPRPVQDKNELAINQFFGELSLPASQHTLLRFRFGKQSLNYGAGTLLDARDANVRRSFIGYKLILEKRLTRIDAFFMKLAGTREGIFDDKVDHNQKVAGVWATQKLSNGGLAKLDFYYIFINRNLTKFNQGLGKESRNTIGSAIYFKKGNWSSYSEVDLQWGRFNHHAILAWKIAPSWAYQLQRATFKPVFSIQGAISSGDRSGDDPDLQTFNPLYPKAIYYGFIDNVGSANIIVVHPKIEFQFNEHFRFIIGHYKFWRQHSSDGIYAVNGSYLLPDTAGNRSVGTMLDVSATYTIDDKYLFQVIGSYYKRGEFLKQQSVTKGNIRYVGVRATLRI